jgi:hypothetical protein
MNLRSLNKIMADIEKCPAGIFRQNCRRDVLSRRPMKPLSVRAGFFATCLSLVALCAFTSPLFSQTNSYPAFGGEFSVNGSLLGDQVYPDVALSASGGFLVWQDNVTDGDAWGVSATKLNSDLSPNLTWQVKRVNEQGGGSQENARVALLKNGGAVFVWQGGKPSFQHIFARFVNSSGAFVGGDVQVNSVSNKFQINPAVAVLNNSNVVVVWSSYNQVGSNSMQDVYAQILTASGQKVGGEFLVNQFTGFNQRTPCVTALSSGGFVVVWISEQERVLAPAWGTNSSYAKASALTVPSVDVYARKFDNNGAASGSELLVNSNLNPCATPNVAAASDGSFTVVWAASDRSALTNSFDIFSRSFNGSGTAISAALLINTYQYGDQYIPRISPLGLDFLVTWTSLAQDGSREGVYGRFIRYNGSPTSSEFRVNTTTVAQQMHPTVASDGANQFLAVWTSFTGLTNQFDLFAQRYVNGTAPLQAMPAPYVWAPFVVSNNIYQPRLVVSWAPLTGLSVSNYEVYINGSATPTAVTTSNLWTMTALNGLTTNSTRSFQVDYVLTDGRKAPISASASGTTWSGLNWYGVPYEWMAAYFGGYFNGNYVTGFWPNPSSRPVEGGPTIKDIFISGGNPYDSTTWLKQSLTRTAQGLFLNWNTLQGAIYQVQVSTNFNSWSNVGTPRFASGTSDSIYVGGSPVGYYRVVLMR